MPGRACMPATWGSPRKRFWCRLWSNATVVGSSSTLVRRVARSSKGGLGQCSTASKTPSTPHLSVAFAALVVARYLEDRTGISPSSDQSSASMLWLITFGVALR